jgi:hypothetical protein
MFLISNCLKFFGYEKVTTVHGFADGSRTRYRRRGGWPKSSRSRRREKEWIIGRSGQIKMKAVCDSQGKWMLFGGFCVQLTGEDSFMRIPSIAEDGLNATCDVSFDYDGQVKFEPMITLDEDEYIFVGEINTVPMNLIPYKFIAPNELRERAIRTHHKLVQMIGSEPPRRRARPAPPPGERAPSPQPYNFPEPSESRMDMDLDDTDESTEGQAVN